MPGLGRKSPRPAGHSPRVPWRSRGRARQPRWLGPVHQSTRRSGPYSRRPSQTPLIVQPLGHRFGAEKEVQNPPELCEGVKRTSQVEPDIDGLRDILATLGKIVKGPKRLVEEN